MKFILNGQEKEYKGDPEVSLLTYLREHENITSVKDGCSAQASCGACTVDVDGKAKLSCATKMSKVDGVKITTPDGLGDYRREVFANAFAEKGGVQCGFCTPGIVMRANALINVNPVPNEDAIKQALTPHICRCTGYAKVVGKNGHEHLKFSVVHPDRSGSPLPAIAFNQGYHYEEMKTGKPFSICYHIDENHWLGQTSLQLRVKDIKFKKQFFP